MEKTFANIWCGSIFNFLHNNNNLVYIGIKLLKIMSTQNINPIKHIYVVPYTILINIGTVLVVRVIKSIIYKSIRSNDLIATGIYGCIIHPIHAAFLHILTGIMVIYKYITIHPPKLYFWNF